MALFTSRLERQAMIRPNHWYDAWALLAVMAWASALSLHGVETTIPSDTLTGTQTIGPFDELGTTAGSATTVVSGADIAFEASNRIVLRSGFEARSGADFRARVGINSPPTIVSAAAASPNPVTGTTTTLAVLARDNSPEGSLIYTWSAPTVPSGGAVTFSMNGGNSAKNSVATFTRAGNYVLRCTVTDPGGLTVTGQVAVTVNASSTALAISPTSAVVQVGGTQAFSASLVDQFGQPVGVQPTSFSWSVSGGGTLSSGSSSRTFTATTQGGPYDVTARISSPVSRIGKAMIHVNKSDRRVTPLVASIMDRAAWNADTNGYRVAYLAGIEPGRIWDTATPGSLVPELIVNPSSHGGSRHIVVSGGGSVSLSVKAAANSPVTFSCTGEAWFLQNNRNVITVQANGSGVATVTFAGQQLGHVSVLVASPFSANQIKFNVERLP